MFYASGMQKDRCTYKTIMIDGHTCGIGHPWFVRNVVRRYPAKPLTPHMHWVIKRKGSRMPCHRRRKQPCDSSTATDQLGDWLSPNEDQVKQACKKQHSSCRIQHLYAFLMCEMLILSQVGSGSLVVTNTSLGPRLSRLLSPGTEANTDEPISPWHGGGEQKGCHCLGVCYRALEILRQSIPYCCLVGNGGMGLWLVVIIDHSLIPY